MNGRRAPVDASAVLRTEVVSSMAEVDPQEWNAIAADAGFYSCWEWLRCVQEFGQGPVGAVLVRAGDELVAARPFWSGRGDERGLHDPRTVLGELADDRTGTLVASSRRSYRSAPILRDPADAATVAPLVLAALRGRAGDPAATRSLLMYADRADVDHFRAALGGRPPLLHSADALVPIELDEGADADYPVAVSSSRHKRIRQEQRAFAAAGLTSDVAKLADCVEEFARLATGVETKYGRPPDVAGLTAQLGAQVEFCGDRDVVFTARAGGDLVAAALGYVHGGELTVRMFGADEARTAGTLAYFVVTYYLPARWARQHGLRRMNLGPGSAATKTARGARLRPLWCLDLDADPSWPARTVLDVTRRRAEALSLSLSLDRSASTADVVAV